MNESDHRVDPLLRLARNQMERVSNVHLVHIAIVSGKDETRVLGFDAGCLERKIGDDVAALILRIEALGAIIVSPARRHGKYGATVTLIDRRIDTFYVPIVRIINADVLIADFRPADIDPSALHYRVRAELARNWSKRSGK